MSVIAVDFDGTIVEHEYPDIGEEVPNAMRVLKRLMEEGHQLILYTMRSGPELRAAYDFCYKNGIRFMGVNCHPHQLTWTNSPKVSANYYIDDAAIGCPLVTNKTTRPYVQWLVVECILQSLGLLKGAEAL